MNSLKQQTHYTHTQFSEYAIDGNVEINDIQYLRQYHQYHIVMVVTRNILT